MNQKQLLKLGEDKLNKANIEDAYFKSIKLLEYILSQSKQQLVMNCEEEVSNKKEKEYFANIDKIKNGVPLQYITNNQIFMGLDFYVDENVLIPQPDTEILVEETIKIINQIKQTKNKIKILDLCTGSGAIAICLAKYCNMVEVTATDISKEALEIAQKNANINNVNIKFIQSDLFENIEKNQFDIIISNPPYIETEIINTLSKEVQNEPHIALDGGKDGLEFYKKILKKAPDYLNNNGYILLEIGYNQGQSVIQLAENNYKIITKKPIKDLGDNDRVVIFKV